MTVLGLKISRRSAGLSLCFLAAFGLMSLPAPAAAAACPTSITVDPSPVWLGGPITVSGNGWDAGVEVFVGFFEGDPHIGDATTDSSGSFSFSTTVPDGITVGTVNLRVQDGSGDCQFYQQLNVLAGMVTLPTTTTTTTPTTTTTTTTTPTTTTTTATTTTTTTTTTTLVPVPLVVAENVGKAPDAPVSTEDTSTETPHKVVESPVTTVGDADGVAASPPDPKETNSVVVILLVGVAVAVVVLGGRLWVRKTYQGTIRGGS